MAPAIALVISRGIKGLIKSAEVAITTKGAGESRKAVVVKALQAFVSGAIGAGEEGIPGDAPLPTEAELSAQVEMAFQSMKRSGDLALANVEESQAMYLVRGGQVTRISLGQ